MLQAFAAEPVAAHRGAVGINTLRTANCHFNAESSCLACSYPKLLLANENLGVGLDELQGLGLKDYN